MTIDHLDPDRLAAMARHPSRRKAAPVSITVYTKANCQQCTATCRWLDKRGHDYTTINLETSPQDMAAVKELGYQAAPVVLVSQLGGPDVHWSGFQPTRLSEHLGEVAGA